MEILAMSVIGDRIKELCVRNRMTLSEVCAKAGVTYKTLHAQISNDRAIPFDTIDRVARALNVPMDYFSAHRPTISIQTSQKNSVLHERAAAAYTAALRGEQIEMMRQGFGIGTDEVLNWLSVHGGVLTNFDALREKVDLFERVHADDDMLQPNHIGRESLATRFFRLENEDHYRRTVGGFDKQIIEEVMFAHIEASKHKYVITDLDIDVCVGRDRVAGSYRRIIAPVKDLHGKEYTLVHARLI
jgi:transcriptional regulator with XRE-family HTH domain